MKNDICCIYFRCLFALFFAENMDPMIRKDYEIRVASNRSHFLVSLTVEF